MLKVEEKNRVSKGFSIPEVWESNPDINYDYHHYYEVLTVLDSDIGPCVICDKPMAQLRAKQYTEHNGYKYAMTFDYIQAHADGSDSHGRMMDKAKPKCPQCGKFGTITYTQEAYLDRTSCSECSYNSVYMIGD